MYDSRLFASYHGLVCSLFAKCAPRCSTVTVKFATARSVFSFVNATLPSLVNSLCWVTHFHIKSPRKHHKNLHTMSPSAAHHVLTFQQPTTTCTF